MKPPIARALAVTQTKLLCLTASFLATNGFKTVFQGSHKLWKSSKPENHGIRKYLNNYGKNHEIL